MTFLCKLGWHKWEFRTEVEEHDAPDIQLEPYDWQSEMMRPFVTAMSVLKVTTRTRCTREGCDCHLWWSTVDVEYQAVA